MSDAESPSRKDKAGVYLALGKSAQERFNVHHSVEWKVHFGLWTLFVGGAYLLTTQQWKPTAPECLLLNVLAVALLVVYWYWWLPHSHQYREECTRTRWWWEGCAWEELIWEKRDRKLPQELHPDGWRLPSDENWNDWCERGWIHVSQLMSVVVTVCFALLFLGAPWVKFDKCTNYSEGLFMSWAAGIGGGLVGGAILFGVLYYWHYKGWERRLKDLERKVEKCQDTQ